MDELTNQPNTIKVKAFNIDLPVDLHGAIKTEALSRELAGASVATMSGLIIEILSERLLPERKASQAAPNGG